MNAPGEASASLLAVEERGDRLELRGALNIRSLALAEQLLRPGRTKRAARMTLDLRELEGLDTPGALLLCALARDRFELTGIRPEHAGLLTLIGGLEAKTLPAQPSKACWRQLVIQRLRKDTPVKTDTRASLKLKGITGVVYIELNGASPTAERLTEATPEGRIPEIPYEKSSIAVLVEQVPKVLQKLAALEDQTSRAVADIRGVTRQIKDNPSVLLWGPKDKNETEPAARERAKAEAAGPRAAVSARAK